MSMPMDDDEILMGIRAVVFDFDGVFTNNQVYVDESGKESVVCWRGDGIGLKRLHELGYKTCIVSSETNGVVSKRAKKLKMRCIQGIEDKLSILRKLSSEWNTDLSNIAYVGNDTNDSACLSAVGFPIVVADAHPDVLSLAKYLTKRKGGVGAVREVCDIFSNLNRGR